MQGWLEHSRDPLTEVALRSLRRNVAFNRSALPPFRLPRVAEQVIAGLAAFLGQDSAQMATSLGAQLAEQGLALRSLLALNRALVREVGSRLAEAEAPGVLERLEAFADLLVEGLAQHEVHSVVRQRDELQVAHERAVTKRESALRQVIQELSTPIMPVHDRILVLPLVGGIDRDRAHKITENLLDEVTRRKARVIIMDITGVPVMDADIAAALLGAAKAVQLLGARPVVVGIRPEIASVLVDTGIDLAGLLTLANLQTGIEWALAQQGLAVARRAGARMGT